MIVARNRPSWARDMNAVSVRGLDVDALKQAAAARGLKIAEMVHVSVDGTDALYARGE